MGVLSVVKNLFLAHGVTSAHAITMTSLLAQCLARPEWPQYSKPLSFAPNWYHQVASKPEIREPKSINSMAKSLIGTRAPDKVTLFLTFEI